RADQLERVQRELVCGAEPALRPPLPRRARLGRAPPRPRSHPPDHRDLLVGRGRPFDVAGPSARSVGLAAGTVVRTISSLCIYRYKCPTDLVLDDRDGGAPHAPDTAS